MDETDVRSIDDAQHSRARRRLAIIAALTLSLIPSLIIAQNGTWHSPNGARHQSLFDDSMISMSYARTLASGAGLVWFPGAPHVEGITNLGWTLVMALVHGIGLSGDGAVVAVKLLGLASVWGAAVVAIRIGRPVRGSGAVTAHFLTAGVVALNVPLLFWAVQGTEVGLFTLLTLLTCLLAWQVTRAEGDTRLVQLCLAGVAVAGIVTRTDFVVIPVAVVTWAVVVARERWRAVALPLVVGVAVALVGTTIFRLAYYGDPLPNTYYLKLTGVGLVTRLARGVVVVSASGLVLVAPSLTCIAALWKRLSGIERRVVTLLLSCVVVLLLYTAYVGGDAWEDMGNPDRYLTPALVGAMLAAALATLAVLRNEAVDSAVTKLGWRLLAAVAALVCLGPIAASIAARAGSAITASGPDVRWSNIVFGSVAALVVCAFVVGAALLAARRWPARTASAIACAVVVVLLAGAAATYPRTGKRDADATAFATFGAQLAQVTDRDAVIAVTGAGASQYFSRRPMIDVLGRSDRHVARTSPTTDEFLPGHDRWDIGYSIGELQPDVVAQAPATHRELRRLGYSPMRMRDGEWRDGLRYRGQFVVYVRDGSPHVRYERLEAPR